MQQKVYSTIKKYHMLDGVRLCYIALSGGADSVCLFHIMNGLCKSLNIPVAIVHVNHKLRADAKRDEDFVRTFAKEQNVPINVLQADVLVFAKEQKMGVEEAGRCVRYKFFEELLAKTENSVMAIAHTASDNAETVLFNLFRGAGGNGLSGISPKRGRYIRPLIECDRDEIETYAHENSLAFIEDESNSDVRYTRNKIRHELIPLLKKEFSPTLVQKLSTQSELLRADNEFLDRCAEKYILYIYRGNQRIAVDRELLVQAEKPLLYRGLQKIVKENFDFSLSHEQIVFCAAQLQKAENKRINCLPRGLKLEISYGQAIFCCNANLPYMKLEPQMLELGENKIAGFGKINVEVIKNLHFSQKNVDKYCMNYDIMKGTDFSSLFLRGRQEGDFLKLQGKKTRSLKKMYIDAKIPARRRGMLPIVLFDEKILCAYPFGAAQDFAPTEETCELLKITFNEENDNED